MKTNGIQISDYDFTLLSEMIREQWCRGRYDGPLMALKNKLDSALVIANHDFPPDVVTLNSILGLKEMQSNQEMLCKLTVSRDPNESCRQIPILTPLGVSVLGQTVGAVIVLESPQDCRQFRIRTLRHQPENDYRLHRTQMNSYGNPYRNASHGIMDN